MLLPTEYFTLRREFTMSFFRRTKSAAGSSSSAETVNETMRRRADGFIATLQQHRPQEFEKLLREISQGDLTRARLTLRELSSIVDEGYIDPVLQQLQIRVAASQTSNEQTL
jgi:hypothetical protein